MLANTDPTKRASKIHRKVSLCACYKQEYNSERREKVSSNSLNSRQGKKKKPPPQKARTE